MAKKFNGAKKITLEEAAKEVTINLAELPVYSRANLGKSREVRYHAEHGHLPDTRTNNSSDGRVFVGEKEGHNYYCVRVSSQRGDSPGVARILVKVAKGDFDRETQTVSRLATAYRQGNLDTTRQERRAESIVEDLPSLTPEQRQTILDKLLQEEK